MQTYVWSILIFAFVIDIIRLKVNYSPPSNVTNSPSDIPDIPEMKNDEPMKIQTDDGEDLEISYTKKEESESVPSPKKKKNKNKRKTLSEQIHLHVQLCMS